MDASDCLIANVLLGGKCLASANDLHLLLIASSGRDYTDTICLRCRKRWSISSVNWPAIEKYRREEGSGSP